MQEKKPYPNLVDSVGLTLLFIILLLVLSPIVVSFIIDEDKTGGDYGLATMLRYLFVILIVFATGYYYKTKSAKPGIFPLKHIGIIPSIVSIVALFCIVYITDVIFYWFPMPDEWTKEFKSFLAPDPYIFIAAGILAPVFEELIFRGIILDGLLQRYKPGTAIFISSVLFGAIHLNVWQFTGAGVDGLLYGWMYVHSRSLWPSIMLHAAKNISATIAGYYSEFDGLSLADEMGVPYYFMGIAVAMLLLTGCMRYLDRHFKRRNVTVAGTGETPM